MGKTSCLSFSFPGRVLLFQAPKLNQANRHVCLALLEVPLAGHGKRETFCWVALPSQCACVPPEIRGLGTVSRAYTSRASTIDLWEQMARKNPNSSIQYCYTSSNKNCSVEEPRSSLHFRSWSSASNLITHFPAFPIEIHLTCFVA